MRTYFFFFLLLLPTVALSQAKSFVCTSDPFSAQKASTVLSKSQAAYEGVKRLQADFLQDSYLAALDVSEASEGRVVFEKPGRMRWDYVEPERQLFLIDQRDFTLVQYAQKQVVYSEVKEIFLSDLPVSFLLGIGSLEERFEVIKACTAQDGYLLELSPQNAQPDDGLKTFFLLVDQDSFLPKGGKTVDVGGNITAILLQKARKIEDVPTGTFQVEIPSDFDVQDNRDSG